MTTFYLSRDEVRELDRRAIEEFDVPGIVLMENAGRGCAELLMRLNTERKPVVILCGPGNNGGDGFVMARHLENQGTSVCTWLFAPSRAPTGDGIRVGTQPRLTVDAESNFTIWQHGHVTAVVDPAAPQLPRNWRNRLTDEFLQCGYVVDSLFGSGLTRSLDGVNAEVVGLVHASGRPVLAIDVPSGLDCDSGVPLGPAVRATHTATFVAHKRGFLNPESHQWTGEIHVVDVGAPRTLVEEYRRRAR